MVHICMCYLHKERKIKERDTRASKNIFSLFTCLYKSAYMRKEILRSIDLYGTGQLAPAHTRLHISCVEIYIHEFDPRLAWHTVRLCGITCQRTCTHEKMQAGYGCAWVLCCHATPVYTMYTYTDVSVPAAEHVRGALSVQIQ